MDKDNKIYYYYVSLNYKGYTWSNTVSSMWLAANIDKYGGILKTRRATDKEVSGYTLSNDFLLKE